MLEWTELELLALPVLWLTDRLMEPDSGSEGETDTALVLGLQDPVLMVRDLGGDLGDTRPLSVPRTLLKLPGL